MAVIQGIINAATMHFSDGDPNTVEHVWQSFLHVGDAALRHEGCNDSVWAHLGRQRPRAVRISNNAESECAFWG